MAGETHYGGTHDDSGIGFTDITTNDVSITKHGFVPKAPNDTTKFLRGDATWAAVPAAGLTRAGGTQSETTTTSATDVDLVTISGLSISPGTPVRIVLGFRKASAVFTGRIGLKLNTTIVSETQNVTSNLAVAESGYGFIEFIYGRTNYLRSGLLTFVCFGSGLTLSNYGFQTADMPTATLTGITLRARADGTNAFGIQDVQVYTGAVA